MVIRVQRKNKAGKEYEVWEGKEEVRAEPSKPKG